MIDFVDFRFHSIMIIDFNEIRLSITQLVLGVGFRLHVDSTDSFSWIRLSIFFDFNYRVYWNSIRYRMFNMNLNLIHLPNVISNQLLISSKYSYRSNSILTIDFVEIQFLINWLNYFSILFGYFIVNYAWI